MFHFELTQFRYFLLILKVKSFKHIKNFMMHIITKKCEKKTNCLQLICARVIPLKRYSELLEPNKTWQIFYWWKLENEVRDTLASLYTLGTQRYTLKCGIVVHVRLSIFDIFSHLYNLISHCTFINFSHELLVKL